MIEEWARAVAADDRKGVLANHSPDLIYDIPGAKKGIDAYNKQWDFFYLNPRGPISFVPSDIEVTAGDDLTFATRLVHCDGTP